jgi:3-hydroxyacyl-CoA dehydrogenase/3a,7a,12a-trihydroxy-5b-cholest-24-enoyl-CoA hydratase
MPPSALDPAQLVGYRPPPFTVAYDERDVALYALGVGAPADPLDPDELKFVYELSGAGFVALPTFSTLALSRMVTALLGGLPGVPPFNPMLLVHGEHAMTTYRPTPTRGTLEVRPHVSAVYDKGSGALIVIDLDVYVEDAEIARHQASLFIRGLGGFGGERGASSVEWTPDRTPDATHEERTSPAQGLLYRLSGDSNPLHADPALAALGGFDRPILHGLCSYGYAARAILRHLCGNDPARLRALRARFAKPVFPGETLRTDLWRAGEQIFFRTSVVERGEVALSHGVARIWTA